MSRLFCWLFGHVWGEFEPSYPGWWRRECKRCGTERTGKIDGEQS